MHTDDEMLFWGHANLSILYTLTALKTWPTQGRNAL